MTVVWTFKAKIESKYCHLSLPSEPELDLCSHWLIVGQRGSQPYLLLSEPRKVLWPFLTLLTHFRQGHSFLWALQIPHSFPLHFLDSLLNLLWRWLFSFWCSPGFDLGLSPLLCSLSSGILICSHNLSYHPSVKGCLPFWAPQLCNSCFTGHLHSRSSMQCILQIL